MEMIRARFGRFWMVWVAAGVWMIALPAWLLWPRPPQLIPTPEQRFSTFQELPAPMLEVAKTQPLFTPGRRPVTPEDVAGESEEAALTIEQPLPVLVGTIAGRADSIALLRTADGDTGRVHVGDTIDGWDVIAISNRAVGLARDDRRETLRLEFEAHPVTSAAADAQLSDEVAVTPAQPEPSPLPKLAN